MNSPARSATVQISTNFLRKLYLQRSLIWNFVVRDLKVRFHTAEGTVHAVNGISYSLNSGETLAVVGESGCGKSVSMMSMLSLIPIPPGEIVSGEAHYRGKDLLALDGMYNHLYETQFNTNGDVLKYSS